MKSVFRPLLIVMILSVAAPANAQDCDLSAVDRARDLHETLSLRAIEIIRRASSSGWAHDEQLARLVLPSATFNLGAGDVGRTFEPGVAGAHSLATNLHAGSYRYLGWDYMNLPASGCERREITVEFIDTARQSTAQIEFIFEAGKVVSARGWQRTFETGLIAEP